MFAWFNDLLSHTNEFMPHGACYLWLPSILWLHIISDSIIAIAYYSIPFALFYFVKKRTDLAYRWVFVLFAVFICLCGTTHLISIWTIWHPDYWLDGLIKLATALVSIATAFLIWPLIPQLLQLPSPQALQNSEAYLRAIFDATPDAMLISNRQGIITMANQQAEQLLGYSADELLGLSIEILVPECSRHKHSALRAEFAASASSRPMGAGTIIKALCKNGSELAVEISLSPIKTAQGLFFASALRNISERIKAEAKLRASEERFRRMANGSPVMIWLTDAIGEPSFVNKAWLDFTGFDPLQTMTYESWITTIHPDDRKTAFAGYYQSLEPQQVITSEYRLRNANGDWRWVLDNGVPLYDENSIFIGYIGSAIDITDRKQVENEILSTKNQLQATLNAIPDLLFDVDGNGFFYNFHAPSTELLTIPPEQFLGKTISDVMPSDAATIILSALEEAQQKGKSTGKQFRLNLSQANFWFELSVAVKPSNDKEPLARFIVLSRDITERKQLEIQREQFFKFFNLAPDLQCITNPEGFFKEVNPAFIKTLGYSKEDLLQKPFIEFVAPEDRSQTLSKTQKLLNQTVILDFENRYLCQDGSICCLSWKAVFEPTEQLIYAVARDVTEAKKNEDKLQLAEMVYQNSIEGILVTDAHNQIIAANPAFTEITGYTLDDVAGKNPKIFKSDRHEPDFYQRMWQDITTKGHWQGEVWDKRKTGELHAKFLSITTILNKEGLVHRYLALFSDITARKQYEEEIRRLSDSELNKAKLEAEKANRAKSDFLSSMSHELRTPMNAVLGFAQLLEFEDLTPEQRDSVKEILTAGHHLLDLINQVLDLSKIESEKLEINLENYDLATLIQDCVILTRPLTFKNNITVINETATNCHCTVMIDSLHFKQVLLNLISNAIKYNRVGGSVTLACEVINPQTVRVKITDTGNGLSEAQIAKLFQPFERLSAKNSNIEGSGIGLCISKKLIEGMNGTIGVNSTVGVGSCFWVDIPLA